VGEDVKPPAHMQQVDDRDHVTDEEHARASHEVKWHLPHLYRREYGCLEAWHAQDDPLSTLARDANHLQQGDLGCTKQSMGGQLHVAQQRNHCIGQASDVEVEHTPDNELAHRLRQEVIKCRSARPKRQVTRRSNQWVGHAYLYEHVDELEHKTKGTSQAIRTQVKGRVDSSHGTGLSSGKK
jgi:hypothetical protein